jgi:Fur family transcriptional regulator, ferric uptake regulator
MPSADTLTWSDHVHAVLARAGLRRGGVRERVIALLESQPCALNAVEIEEALRSEGRPAGRASVYRVLELLVEHGLLERVEVGDGVSRFEPMLPSGQHHHHLVCDSCGRLVAFDDPALERAIERASSRLGARVDRHEIVLRGACADCE